MHRKSGGVGSLNSFCRASINGRQCILFLFREPADDHIKYGREQQAEERDTGHSREDGRPQSLPHFRARAFREDERHHAENERETGHQDRTQTKPRGLDGGFSARFALIL